MKVVGFPRRSAIHFQRKNHLPITPSLPQPLFPDHHERPRTTKRPPNRLVAQDFSEKKFRRTRRDRAFSVCGGDVHAPDF